ncbi:KIF-binding protein [Lampetra fluviatilis]
MTSSRHRVSAMEHRDGGDGGGDGGGYGGVGGEEFAQWRVKYAEARRLSEVEAKRDPPGEPFKSKYAARELLYELKRALSGRGEGGGGGGDEEEEQRQQQQREEGEGWEATGAAAPGGRGERLLSAALELQIGVNLMETEELAGAEEHLEACLSGLRAEGLAPDAVSVLMHAQNQLGILWANRDDMSKARVLLENSEALYKTFMKEVGTPPLDIHDLFTKEDDKCSEQQRRLRFELAHTHTLYYLAQAYKSGEENERAARYCHLTLQRQLQWQHYDPVEWATNAATLSQYYVAHQRYRVGRHCLAAAEVVLGQAKTSVDTEEAEDMDCAQRIAQRQAEVARCWIKYCLNLLEDSRKQLEDDISELDTERQSELHAERQRQHEQGNGDMDGDWNGNNEGSDGADIKFSSLVSVADMLEALAGAEERVPCRKALSFQEAREIFLFGQARVTQAKEFFVLDGHASDYVQIVRDQSALFKALAFFEEDLERRCRMQKRRVDMLEGLYTQLNPQFYLTACRQLCFEVADTYYDMMDLKVALANHAEQLQPHTVKKINLLARAALTHYQKFLDSLCNSRGETPATLDIDVVRPALVAKFRMGRLHSKLMVSDTASRLANARLSLECYRYVVDYCDQNPDVEEVAQPELELSREMVTLLPAKIQHMAAGSQVFN